MATRRLRIQARVLNADAAAFSASIGDFVQTLQQQTARLTDAEATQLPDPPDGQRYTTMEEYSVEFSNKQTTPARQLAILAICCRLLPAETVDVAVTAQPIDTQPTSGTANG